MPTDPNIAIMQNSYDLWNGLNLVLLILAGAAAVGLAIASIRMSQTGKVLLDAKDRQLETNLKDKDLQIKRVETQAAKDIESTRAQAAKDKQDADTKIAALTVEAEDARKEIAKAQARAADANKLAQESRTKQMELEQQNTVLQTDLADAQRSLLEVQERTSPRRITGEQKGRIVALLKSFPKGTVVVQCADGDPESYLFAKQVIDVLKAVPFDVTGPRAILGQGGQPRALCIEVRSAQEPKWAGPLQKLLGEMGFPTDGRLSSAAPQDGAVIFVGSKPVQ